MSFEGAPVDLRSLSTVQLQHLLEASREAGREGLVAAAEGEFQARRSSGSRRFDPVAFDDVGFDPDAVDRGAAGEAGGRPRDGNPHEALASRRDLVQPARRRAAPADIVITGAGEVHGAEGPEAPAEHRPDPYNFRLHREPAGEGRRRSTARWVDSTGRIVGGPPPQAKEPAVPTDRPAPSPPRSRYDRHPASDWRRLEVLGVAAIAGLVAVLAAPWLMKGWRAPAPSERAIATAAPPQAPPSQGERPQPSPPGSGGAERPRVAMARVPPDLRGEIIELPTAKAGSLPPSRGRSLATARNGPAFHCDWRLRPSEKMVCGDAELSGLDRRLNSAFSRAVSAGVPRAALRAEQDAWVWRRERAAQQSRQAVEDLYRERIQVLTRMAEAG